MYVRADVSACEKGKNTYLENFKSINVQHSDIKLLMIFHHGFVDGLKSKDCVTKIKLYYRLSQLCYLWQLNTEL